MMMMICRSLSLVSEHLYHIWFIFCLPGGCGVPATPWRSWHSYLSFPMPGTDSYEHHIFARLTDMTLASSVRVLEKGFEQLKQLQAIFHMARARRELNSLSKMREELQTEVRQIVDELNPDHGYLVTRNEMIICVTPDMHYAGSSEKSFGGMEFIKRCNGSGNLKRVKVRRASARFIDVAPIRSLPTILSTLSLQRGYSGLRNNERLSCG